ncbi:MAG: DUF1800 domain-containing protein [Verrucomicrobiota bacterium]
MSTNLGKRCIRKSVLTIIASVSFLNHALAQYNSLSDSTEIGTTGVYLSPWLGTYSQSGTTSPWLFTDTIGWVYLYEDADSIWLYNEELSGWLWTTQSNFPYAYSASLGWIYFTRIAPLSYYYQFNTKAWYTLEKAWYSPILNSQERAARFLSQATLGADYETVNSVTQIGPERWLNSQFQLPVVTLRSAIERIFQDDDGQYQPEFMEVENFTFRTAWWERVISGNDLLRQRITLALSEIFVISDAGELNEHPVAIASYYDMLQRHALGNFRDLLYDVTLHPCMGFYLSHAGNRRPDPATGRFPDENYAREIMQLFTIGLYELNMDGSRKLDPQGNPIPTYDNSDITEFARVYTGIHYDIRQEIGVIASDPEITNSPNLETITFDEIMAFELINFEDPMIFFEREHDTDSKSLLNGTIIPAGQTIQQDLNAALDNLFNHPSAPPFVSKLLIQRLVKSNPSPAYINRVANAFVDNGQGSRGDMKAIISAILLDVEARTPDMLSDINHGKMREPFFKLIHFMRAFNATPAVGTHYLWDYESSEIFGQRPLSSPSVFNFFLPDYMPSGPVGDAGLVAPEFQIANSSTLSTTLNTLHGVIVDDEIQQREYDPENLEYAQYQEFFTEWSVDLKDEIALTGNLSALIDRLDLVLTYGRLSEGTRSAIISGLQNFSNLEGIGNETLVRLAIYLIMASPDYNITR